MINEAFDRFGKESFRQAIFYSQESGLRFELAEGDSYVKHFISAYNKSHAILSGLFSDLDLISVCIAFCGKSYISRLSLFRNLKKLQFHVPDYHQVHTEWDDDWEYQRTYLFFYVDKKQFSNLLFGKLAAELGISPSIWCDLYFYDLDMGVLAHPYDDRGMDVVGPNDTLIKKLYIQYSDWLLQYGIEKMKAYYDNLNPSDI